MAFISLDWVNDEVIEDLINSQNDLDGYILEVEEELTVLCVTQGQTALNDIPTDDTTGLWTSPILKILARMKLQKCIYDGYVGSSAGNVDIYAEKSDKNLDEKIAKWENKITYNSIRVEVESASSSQSTSRSVPLG